ncbi:MAG TPA: response regulator, partial [Pyrinomonadaceae bacterium]|nr:response regulator [Pyrinomonadaceae bacterium]
MATATDRQKIAKDNFPVPDSGERKVSLLVVEDDENISTAISEYFSRAGYNVRTVEDGLNGVKAALDDPPDAVVLDLMLPKMDGLAVCKELREKVGYLPILMLTAKDDVVDKVLGLEMGADDYLPKVANPRELLARIRAVLRRAGAPANGTPPETKRVLEFNGWRLNVAQRQLFSPNNALVALRAGEFDLLLALAERPQRVMTRDQLLDLSRGPTANNFDRSID